MSHDATALPTHPSLTLDEVRSRPTITAPEVGKLLGLGRDAVYDAIRRGQIPSIRVGRRVLVPVPALLRMLGAQDAHEVA